MVTGLPARWARRTGSTVVSPSPATTCDHRPRPGRAGWREAGPRSRALAEVVAGEGKAGEGKEGHGGDGDGPVLAAGAGQDGPGRAGVPAGQDGGQVGGWMAGLGPGDVPGPRRLAPTLLFSQPPRPAAGANEPTIWGHDR